MMPAIKMAVILLITSSAFIASEIIGVSGAEAPAALTVTMPVAQQDVILSPASSGLIMDLVKMLGPMVFLGWYCYYVTSRVLPAKDKSIDDNREAFRVEMKLERDAHQARNDVLVAELREQGQTILRMVESCKSVRANVLDQGRRNEQDAQQAIRSVQQNRRSDQQNVREEKQDARDH
jgi:hypothetical protein